MALYAADGGEGKQNKNRAANLRSQPEIVRLNRQPRSVQVRIKNDVYRILNEIEH